jgi:hypothetical protein
MGMSADADDLPLTGTCGLSTKGRRSGQTRRVEIGCVIIDGQIVIIGIPGARTWLATLGDHPESASARRRRRPVCCAVSSFDCETNQACSTCPGRPKQ